MVDFQISDLPCQRFEYEALPLQESPVLVQNQVLARMTDCCLREGWWAGALPPAARRARERGVRAAPDIRRARRRLQLARLRPPPPGLAPATPSEPFRPVKGGCDDPSVGT